MNITSDRTRTGLGGLATAVAVCVAAGALAAGRGIQEAVFFLILGLTAAAAISGWASRFKWILPALVWTALSLPFVKHLGSEGGAPAINADHVILFPVDFVLAIALAWAVLSAVKRAEGGGRDVRSVARALADLLKPDLVASAVIALAAAAILSAYNAPRPELAFIALVDLARLYAGYVLFRRLAADGPTPVAIGFLAAAAFQGALCLVEFGAQNNFGLWEKPGWGAFIFAGASPDAGGLLLARGGGTFEPNTTAQFLQMAVPFAAAYFLTAASRKARWSYLVALLLTLGGAFVTFSRGGWLGAAVALAIVVAGAWARKKSMPIRTGGLVALTIVGVALLIPAAVVMFARGAEGDQLSAASRVGDWETALAIIRDHPLIGVGRGNYLELSRLYNPWALAYPVHNIYLYMLAETGMVGFGAFLLLLYGVFRAAGRALRKAASNPYTATFGLAGTATFGLAALGAFAGIALRMFVSMSFVHPFVFLTFVALAAAAAGAVRSSSTDNSSGSAG
jgi:O-antigen ligase